MEEILHQLMDDITFLVSWVSYILTGAGCLPSTVCRAINTDAFVCLESGWSVLIESFAFSSEPVFVWNVLKS